MREKVSETCPDYPISKIRSPDAKLRMCADGQVDLGRKIVAQIC